MCVDIVDALGVQNNDIDLLPFVLLSTKIKKAGEYYCESFILSFSQQQFSWYLLASMLKLVKKYNQRIYFYVWVNRFVCIQHVVYSVLACIHAYC